MNSYIFVLLSILIFAPVFFLLDLGITKKGKLYILGFSCVFSFVGLLCKAIFETWQIILILFLLVILSTLMISKRKWFDLFFADGESISITGENEYQSLHVEEENILSEQRDEEVEKKELFIQAQHEEMIEELTPYEKMDDPLNDEDYILDETIEMLEEEEQNEEIQEVMEDLTLDGMNLTFFENQNENKLIDGPIEEEEALENHYLADLEQMILGDDVSSKSDDENETLFATEQPVMMEEILLDDPLEQTDLPLEEIGSVPQEAAHNLHDHWENIDEEISETNKQLKHDFEKEQLQKQLFNTMISQIQLTRKLIDSKKYEQLLKEYLHPELPIYEYYTFATLLVHHYISKRQFEKLAAFLTQLEEKVTNHPVLLQEIQFLKSIKEEKYRNLL